MHLNKADSYADVKDKSFVHYMNSERTELLVNFDNVDAFPHLDDDEDQASSILRIRTT